MILFAATALFFASPVLAAETFFEVRNPDIQTGDMFEVQFFLNTDQEVMNAIEGRIVFPEALLRVEEVRDGNSVVNYWIERPKASNGEITFSGMIPGGYFGRKGLILSVVFQSIQTGQGSIEVRDLNVLQNDGKGTKATTTSSNLPLVVLERTSSTRPMAVLMKDADPPEAFEPMFARDPSMFEGRYFLAFSAQDKGSGIDRYEVREGDGPFMVAESPHLLQNQHLDTEIAVKAVDRMGNERIAVLPPQRPQPRYQYYWILAILLAAGFCIAGIVLRKMLWRGHTKQN